jgi:hypothetical protein
MKLGLAGSASKPALPTYRTVAGVLERDKGAGWALVGWTVARTALIAPPMMIVGVDPKKAIAGAAFASGLISIFTLLRIFNAKHEGLGRARSKHR